MTAEFVTGNKSHRIVSANGCEAYLTGKLSGLRWWVIGLIFLTALINFLNRLAIAVLGPVITVQLGMSNSQFAALTTSFLIAYTASQGLSGILYDKVGTKLGFIISVVVWSLSSMAHAFAKGLISLCSLRFLLGLGEGGTWPGAAKAIAEWFPVKERALAMGICNSGTAIGSVIATPVILWIELRFGWRTTFLVIGALGFLWLILWFCFYKPGESSPTLTAQAPAIPSSGEPSNIPQKIPWLQLLHRREAWAVIMARFFGDPVWWFYITWLPLYLFRVRHLSLQQISLFAWMPFAAADAGSLFGGWLSGYLIDRGWSVNRARKSVLLGGMVLMCCGIPVALTQSVLTALTLIAIVLFGYQAWIGNVQTLPSDYFPSGAVGSVMGMGGVGAGIGAMLLTQATGSIVDHYSYAPVLVTAGLLPVIATIVLFRFGKTIQPISL